MFKKVFLFLLMAMQFLACNSNDEHTKATEHHHADNAANEHMHHRPVSELIDDFESPERDAYQKPEEVVALLGDISGQNIMDLGAGSGYFTVRLARKGAHVIAADVDDEFLGFINKRIKEKKLDNIETRKIPYDSPELSPDEVDKVLIVNTYHHIEDRAEYFTKVRSGTKMWGELVLIDFYKTDLPIGPPVDHKISMDQVIAELKKAGYKNFDVNVELLPYQFIIRAQ